jgi:hypothetical protein
MFWLQVFGWAGSAVLVISLLQGNMLRLRILNLVASLALVAYNGFLAVWPMVGMNAIVAVIDVYFMVKLRRAPHEINPEKADLEETA